jgi:putative FmdB family regulatory protein
MPLYEYVCEKCGIFEVIQAIKDSEIKVCPNCGKCVEKILSVPSAPKFNGTGFYETDYKNKKE